MKSFLMGATLLMAGTPAAALSAQTGGMLSAYAPRAGARSAFDAGYTDHLAWHEAAGDSLRWFGWDVIVGESLGLFVDGVFGISFAALDRRVDPASDAANAAATFAPHADAAYRYLLRFRPDLSTDDRLATAEPARFVQVVRFTPAPGEVPVLEARLHGFQDDDSFPYSVYEIVAGTRTPSFLVMIWRDALADFDAALSDPARALAREDNGIGAAHAVEVWRYRPDLTYLGSERGN